MFRLDQNRRLELDRNYYAFVPANTSRFAVAVRQDPDGPWFEGRGEDPVARARMLNDYANNLEIMETEIDPVVVSAEAVVLAPEGESPLRVRILGTHARLLAGAAAVAAAGTAGGSADAAAAPLAARRAHFTS